MKTPIEISERVYRGMLRAYPEAYRREYAEEMARLFRDLCRDAAERRGTVGLLAVWAFVAGDLLGSLIREHREEGRKAMNSLCRRLRSNPSKDWSPNAVLSSLLSLSALSVLLAAVFKLTSLPLTEGQLIIGLLCTGAVSLQLIILAVLTAPPKASPPPGSDS